MDIVMVTLTATNAIIKPSLLHRQHVAAAVAVAAVEKLISDGDKFDIVLS